MAERLYYFANSAAVTTAAPVGQPTGTSIRTMLQLQIPAAPAGITIAEWGISFDAAAVSTPVKCELFGTTVAATLTTAAQAADIVKYNQIASASGLTLATNGTAFASAAGTEGTVANARMFDQQYVAPTNQYVKQWPLGREPYCDVSTYVRIRVTVGTTVNCFCYIIWSE